MPIYFLEQCLFFFNTTLSLCSRLANSQLEKEKAELIHQIKVHKDQSGAQSTIPGNVLENTLKAHVR